MRAGKVLTRLQGSGIDGATVRNYVTGDAVDSLIYGAATAAPRRGYPAPRPGYPAVAGQDHDVEAEQLGHGEQL